MWKVVCHFSTIIAFISCLAIHRKCPKSHVFGCGFSSVVEPIKTHDGSLAEEYFFRTPFLPFLPCMGMFINWYLISQLQAEGVITLVGFFGVAGAIYLVTRGSSNAFRSPRHAYQRLPNNGDG